MLITKNKYRGFLLTEIIVAMGLLGLCNPDLRLPLCAISAENRDKLKKALKDYGLL